MIKVESNVVDEKHSGAMVYVEGTRLEVHRDFHSVVSSVAKAIMQASENVGGAGARHTAKSMLIATLYCVVDELEKM